MQSPFLLLPGAVAAQDSFVGLAAHFGRPFAEARALVTGLGVVDLSTLELLRISGEDRLSWLHSLTTQDLQGLLPGVSTETLLLSPQGRIEVSAAVVDDGESLWLAVESGLGEKFFAWLQSMVFRMRVAVERVDDRFAVVGACGEGAAAQFLRGFAVREWVDPWPHLGVDAVSYRAEGVPEVSAVESVPLRERGDDLTVLPGPWQLRHFWVPRERLGDVVAGLAPARLIPVGVLAFEAVRIAAWRPRAGAESGPTTIPHEVDWLRTAVHLHKGCYRGQETVARVRNLGKPPRRIVFLSLDGSEDLLPSAGAEVFFPGRARPVGWVSSAARHPDLGPVALALVKRNTPDGALSVRVDGVDVAAAQVWIAAG